MRAKRKIKAARIPYRVPEDAELPGRLRSVVDVLYLVFNEGHSAFSGDELLRADLCAEVVRLAKLLARMLPDEAEVMGLQALMLPAESRRVARTSADRSLVLPADQDGSRWDRPLIQEAGGRRSAGANRPPDHAGCPRAWVTSSAEEWSSCGRTYQDLSATSATQVAGKRNLHLLAATDRSSSVLQGHTCILI